MTHKNLNSRCKAIAKSGEPCRAAATEGGLCFFHANPDKASELGRIGGRGNRRAAGENADPLPTLDNALAVRDTVDSVNRGCLRRQGSSENRCRPGAPFEHAASRHRDNRSGAPNGTIGEGNGKGGGKLGQERRAAAGTARGP
jgi:hypothetical protein